MNTLAKMSGRGLVAVLVVLLLVLGMHLATQGAPTTTTRDINEFVLAQGKYFGAVPPDPNFVAFGTMVITPENNPDRGWSKKATDYIIRYTGTDYAGLAYRTSPEAYSQSGPPQISGTITERPLPDGRTEVTVIMHTEGANVWVMDFDTSDTPAGQADQIANKPTLFGHRPREVAAGAGQALGDCLLHVVFISPAPPGATLPDLIDVVYGPQTPDVPLYELKLLDFSTRAQGPLTAKFGVDEGTPGKCTIVETGLIEVYVKPYGLKGEASEHSRVAFDAFPVENIDLKVIGK